LKLQVKEKEHTVITDGNFICKNCDARYIIHNDIPYFSADIGHSGVRNQYETYSHWFEEMHDEASILNPDNRSYFYNSLRIKASEFRDKIVLDAGCGNGRFSFVVSQNEPKLLVSLDISRGLAKAQETIFRNNPDANIAFVQADLTNPPFKKETFDILYSWGVTHHTPNTKQTFNTLSNLVKEEGIFGIYVYAFNPPYQYDQQIMGLLAYLRSLLLIRPFRFICSRLPVSLVKLIFQPIFYVERLLGVGVFGCHGPPPDVFNKERYFRVVVDRFKT
ncbi:uncharacterized protein METZ01_LOCUS415025, partial [marine metagenome]